MTRVREAHSGDSDLTRGDSDTAHPMQPAAVGGNDGWHAPRWSGRAATNGATARTACSGFAHAPLARQRLRGRGAAARAEAAPNTINVLMVNNPQMVDLQKLTADNFTEGDRHHGELHRAARERRPRQDQPGVLQPGGPVRRRLAVATSRSRSTPSSKWIAPLDDYIAKDTAFDQADILKPMTTSLSKDGKLYGEPFYGESSFLMYRKDVLDAKGITMPAKPTWPQVADIAAKVDGAKPGMAGHLPARPARLGPGLRPADHGRQHLRRHVVRPRTGTPGRRAGVHGRHELLRRPGPRARREGRPAGRVHRVPEQPRPGQRRHVVRRDVGRGVAGGAGLTGAWQVRLRPGARGARPKHSAGSTPGRGHPAGQHRRRTTPGSSSPGRPARSTRSSSARARLVHGAGRQARLDLREP